MPRRRKAIDETKARVARSRVTNGQRFFLPGTDGRSALARRARDIAGAFSADLGGVAHLTEAQKQLVRRAAMVSTHCEMLESKAANGEDIDLELYGKLIDRLGRTLTRLGIKRVAHDVTPALRDYIAAKGAT